MPKCKFMMCKDDPRKVHKNFLYEHEFDCELKIPTDMLNPTLVIKANPQTMLDVSNKYNMAYISTFDRNYFVKNIRVRSTNIVEVDLEIDVLSSHVTAIDNLNAFVERNEFQYNSSLIDNERLLQINNNMKAVQLNESVIDNSLYNIYLTVTGGVE